MWQLKNEFSARSDLKANKSRERGEELHFAQLQNSSLIYAGVICFCSLVGSFIKQEVDFGTAQLHIMASFKEYFGIYWTKMAV